MKKNLLLLIFLSVCIGAKLEAQCQATYTCNAFPAAALPGKVVIYQKKSNMTILDSITYYNVSASTFTILIPDSGRYVLQYIPTPTNYQISYADTGTCWFDATVYNNPCGLGTYANFLCQPYGSAGGTGNGSLSGIVYEGQGFGQRLSNVAAPGNPIGGVIVKAGKNPGGQLFAQTTTNTLGQYSFSNLPAGNYFLQADIPGLDTINPWHVTLNNNAANNLDFIADSNSVIGGGGVSVNEINIQKYSAELFPNPAKSQFSIKYSTRANENVKLEILDILGHKVKEISRLSTQNQGNQKQTVPIEDLRSGLYMVKLSIDSTEMYLKLIVN